MLRKVSQILFASLCLSCCASAQQDFSETVVPISDWKLHGIGIQGSLGTGFCIDPECRFIGTAYHVAALAKPRKINGQGVFQKQFATGPDDEGATLNDVPSFGLMRYNLSRDLGIFELRHPLQHHHGVGFVLGDLQLGQEADIYSYPGNAIKPIRTLQHFQARFRGETESGLLAFDYKLSGDKTIRPGASGGIVIDAKTQRIVGILTAIARDGDLVALAVPVQSLADFFTKVQPFLARMIFPSEKTLEVSPLSVDLYPKFVPSRTDTLQHRPEEPPEVQLLREKAQLLADSIRNFIAVQSFAWGSGDNRPVLETWYEVRVVDGAQRFREYPNGKEEFNEVPLPPLNGWALGADEWSTLPKMVGTEFRLKVRQAADAFVNGRQMRVFQYYSTVEDNLCPFAPVEDFGFFQIRKVVPVACYGEVWTDKDTNIVRISQNLDLSDKSKAYRGWGDYRIIITYGRLKQADRQARLVPLTILTEGRLENRVYWCRGYFSDYRVFKSDVKIGSSLPETQSKVQSSPETIQNDHR